MKIAIGSTNPVKAEAVREVFGHEANKFIELHAVSGVSAQPFGDEETAQGAINRAKACLEKSDADLAIGLEGGVTDTKHGMFVCNWGAISDRSGKILIASGARFLLPEEVSEKVKEGRELGEVMDWFTKRKNIRKKEGAIGIFTNGLVTRQEMYHHLVKLLAGQYEYHAKPLAGK
ncbi:DUF84 family protein [Bacillus marinisedimentorum]|uniref:DUF84 family protein n=1 Tax=Bacillus marinisedimentorum TaxID=1821260 RepID=UPI000871E0F8|nr:DUF84 family protein [Bacillus marinisedimentorum]